MNYKLLLVCLFSSVYIYTADDTTQTPCYYLSPVINKLRKSLREEYPATIAGEVAFARQHTPWITTFEVHGKTFNMADDDLVAQLTTGYVGYLSKCPQYVDLRLSFASATFDFLVKEKETDEYK